MERFVLHLCGLWFWLTRKRRVDAYSSAAASLELAHAYLLRDFTSRASTRDRGVLLPHQSEALSILQRHAVDTYVAATQLTTLRQCCRFVAQEIRQLAAPELVPEFGAAPVVVRPAPAAVHSAPRRIRVRIRLAPLSPPSLTLPRAVRVPSFAGLLRGEASGALWEPRLSAPWRLRHIEAPLTPAPAEQHFPLKAA